MTKIYTKSGDDGTTALIGGERVPKYDMRVEAYGAVDELGAEIAMLTDMAAGLGMKDTVEDLGTVAKDLMRVEALLAAVSDEPAKDVYFDAENVSWLEELIDNASEGLPEQKGFIIPGGAPIISQCHICRTVCRRAERRALMVAASYEVSDSALIYLNRLSDYLFILARKCAEILKIDEIVWIA